MSRISLVAAAGLAVATGANADVMFSFAGPVVLAGGQSAVMFSGNASGALGTFSFSFNYGEVVSDASWASDMQIIVSGPSGSSTIAGFDDPAPDFAVPYDGGGSTAPGVYNAAIDMSGAGLSGSGVWTVTIVNDWAADPNANTVGDFQGNLGGLVPTPGALGLFGIAGLAATRRRR